jgi:hypothetical protein
MIEQHRIGRSEWSVFARSWWKPIVVGVVLVLAVIVGSSVGIDAWFLGFFAVILGCSLIAVGVVLGLAHLVARRSGARA